MQVRGTSIELFRRCFPSARQCNVPVEQPFIILLFADSRHLILHFNFSSSLLIDDLFENKNKTNQLTSESDFNAILYTHSMTTEPLLALVLLCAERQVYQLVEEAELSSVSTTSDGASTAQPLSMKTVSEFPGC